MQKITLLIFLFLFCGFNISAQMKLAQEEYVVYANVLRVIYKENRETYSNKAQFVFLNETKVDLELDLPSGRKYKNLVNDFNQKNSVPKVIEKKFPRGAYSETYYLASQNEIDELLEKGRTETEKRRLTAKESNPSDYIIIPPTSVWMPFYQKYPESIGLHILSRVGFSGQFAMVQVKGDHGWNGFTRNYILKKVNGKWRIITFSGSDWIS